MAIIDLKNNVANDILKCLGVTDKNIVSVKINFEMDAPTMVIIEKFLDADVVDLSALEIIMKKYELTEVRE